MAPRSKFRYAEDDTSLGGKPNAGNVSYSGVESGESEEAPAEEVSPLEAFSRGIERNWLYNPAFNAVHWVRKQLGYPTIPEDQLEKARTARFREAEEQHPILAGAGNLVGAGTVTGVLAGIPGVGGFVSGNIGRALIPGKGVASTIGRGLAGGTVGGATGTLLTKPLEEGRLSLPSKEALTAGTLLGAALGGTLDPLTSAAGKYFPYAWKLTSKAAKAAAERMGVRTRGVDRDLYDLNVNLQRIADTYFEGDKSKALDYFKNRGERTALEGGVLTDPELGDVSASLLQGSRHSGSQKKTLGPRLFKEFEESVREIQPSIPKTLETLANETERAGTDILETVSRKGQSISSSDFEDLLTARMVAEGVDDITARRLSEQYVQEVAFRGETSLPKSLASGTGDDTVGVTLLPRDLKTMATETADVASSGVFAKDPYFKAARASAQEATGMEEQLQKSLDLAHTTINLRKMPQPTSAELAVPGRFSRGLNERLSGVKIPAGTTRTSQKEARKIVADRYRWADIVEDAISKREPIVLPPEVETWLKNTRPDLARKLEAYNKLGIQATQMTGSAPLAPARKYRGVESSGWGASAAASGAIKDIVQSNEARLADLAGKMASASGSDVLNVLESLSHEFSPNKYISPFTGRVVNNLLPTDVETSYPGYDYFEEAEKAERSSELTEAQEASYESGDADRALRLEVTKYYTDPETGEVREYGY